MAAHIPMSRGARPRRRPVMSSARGPGRPDPAEVGEVLLADLGEPTGVPVSLLRRAVTTSISVVVIAFIGFGLAGAILSMDVLVRGQGTLQPREIVPVVCQRTGVVREVFTSSGRTVAGGTLLFVLDSLDAG